MSDGPRPAIEDRLRDHYRHLREHPPVAEPERRPPRILAVAAGLAIVAMAAGAYLSWRAAEPGAPLRADVDAAEGETDDRSTGTSAPTTSEVEPPPSSTTEPTTTTTSQSEETTAGSTDVGSDAVTTVNADGSPKAPRPGTNAPPAEAERALAYGIWEPGRHDSCSKEIHDSYWVYGPDGKVYPTYHPPIDPSTGCTFGHEHGRDPAGSDLADIPFPFGYVSEGAEAAGIGRTSTDHVGHKIEWYNDGGYYDSGRDLSRHDQICDVAYKVHMPTHSGAAFDTNAHEVFLHARCENGSELIYRAMHLFGRGGEFNLHCDQGPGPTVSSGQGAADDGDRAGSREVAAQQCFEDRVLVPEGQRSNWFPFDERWTLYQSVDSVDFGRFFIQLQFFTDLPARYWDGETLARSVDLCYVTGDRQVRDDEFCDPMRDANPGLVVQWDDPASPFDGTDRSIFMADIRLDNDGRQAVWYTDLHGGVWSSDPFPGSIVQHVGITPINAAASYRPDPIRSITFDDDLGIHAPN